MSAENCNNCRFFRLHNFHFATHGECLRYPPVPIIPPDYDDAVAYVPEVEQSHWCGEWKPKGTTSQEIPANAIDPEELS